jgi:hypothetical protein
VLVTVACTVRGFAKPYLKAGESQTVQFELRNKDLAYWSAVYHGLAKPRSDLTGILRGVPSGYVMYS